MTPEYWQERWHTNNIKFNQEQANELLTAYFQALTLEPGKRVFVPLCGKSIDMLWLLQQDYQVIGVELSDLACKAFFDEHKMSVNISTNKDFTIFQGEQITLLAGDFFKLQKALLGHVDAVFDRAALIALPTALRQRYAAHLSDLLEPNTQMLLITITYDQSSMQGPPFSVDEPEVADLYSRQFLIETLYNKPYSKIPPHLHAKGLAQANDLVFQLKKTGSVAMINKTNPLEETNNLRA